jgi:hypothetical protein
MGRGAAQMPLRRAAHVFYGESLFACGAASGRPHGPRPGEELWAYAELAASLVVGNVGGQLFGPPWDAIVPDTIPPSQRGLC